MARRSLLPRPKRVINFDINNLERRPRPRPASPPTPEPEPEARLRQKHKIFADPEVEARWLAFAQEHFEAGEQPGEIWGGKTENTVDTRSDAEKKRDEEIADWEERQIAWLSEEGVKEMKETHPFVYRQWLQERSLEERREREIALRQAQDQAKRGDYSGTKYVDVD
ncbi:hypothetical protein R3P38DRAFT_3207687 [Favolaschia claudopus]|uniref:Uncharacterized protein n=1 Tax=Favolaschia claudopus TaxID=2862362 RepID=A0AAW0AJU2_9AGAR